MKRGILNLLPTFFLLPSSFFIFSACAAPAGRDIYQCDPASWHRNGDVLSSCGDGFAFVSPTIGRDVSVTARVRPTNCASESWATAGVSIYAADRNYWHLALVKSPEEKGSKHFFELAEMFNGEWTAQGRLRCTEHRADGAWEFGKDYLLELKLGAKGIVGEIHEENSGRVVFRSAYEFNAPCANHGRPALHASGGFKALFSGITQEVREGTAVKKLSYPQFPKSKQAPIAEGTGFFRVIERDGRWTAIDPHGSPFTVLGVDHVQPWGMFCEKDGYSHYGRHVEKSYPNLDAWRDETIGRLTSWGFNMLGAGCDVNRLGHRGLVHTIFLNMGDRLCYGDEAFWICKSKKAPCTAFPNVFHPDFAAACDWVAACKCTPDDPWLLGYFIDNELKWWGKSGGEVGMFDAVSALPKNHSAHVALDKFVAGRPITSELKRDFLKLVADRYFAATTAAIRKVDRNHLVLGCRFAGINGAPMVVWEEAAKYCDVVTFNCYPWADIDRNIVLDRCGGESVKIPFDELYAHVKKPMIVTEWSFPALDTGRPCYHGAGQRFPTQAGRVAATELFAKTMLALPYLIGYDYFMWVDQPAAGMSSHFPEDSNYGLIQENGIPHHGITEMFTFLHAESEHWKKAGLPKVRTCPATPVVTERERFLSTSSLPLLSPPTFSSTANDWTLTNGTGLELHGYLSGTHHAIEDVRKHNHRYGTLGGLVQLNVGGGDVWIDAREIRSVDYEREGGCGSVLVTAAGSHGDLRFELVLRATLSPACQDFVADLVSVRNVGKKPFEVKGLYLRPFGEGKVGEGKPEVPNLWKGKKRGEWRMADGRTYSIESGDPDASYFRLWLNEEGGQHPDAIFAPRDLNVVQPGATYTSRRPLSARIVLSEPAEKIERDIVIYGSTPAAISAAVQAKRMGKSAIIVSPETRIGGLTTGGLGQTDIGNKKAFGGIALEFYRDVAKFYRDDRNWKHEKRDEYLPDGQCAGTKGADSMWTFEPSAALKILEGWERRDKLEIVRGERLDRDHGGVERCNGRIVSFRTLSGKIFAGKMFIDATYEGDLMAAAGVSYTVGREANSVYGETISGIQRKRAVSHQFHPGVSAYVDKGNSTSGLLPCVEKDVPDPDGAGDRRVQAYCFRMCLTDVPENRIPFVKPKNYRELDYELLFREFEQMKLHPECKGHGYLSEGDVPNIMSMMPNRKTDANNRTGFSTDFIGQNYAWPEATYAEREQILKRHLDYQMGLMWTLANHPRIPQKVRDYYSKWGTCKDEFDGELGFGWQRQLYVREARRLVGDYVVCQMDCIGKRVAVRPVAMAAYGMDSHHCRRYVDENGFVHNEGDIQDWTAKGKPYPLDYGAILPKRDECVNLLVPVCVSASHMAFGSIRMEPVFFALGQVAATAAAQAIDSRQSVQDIEYAALRARLIKDGQVLK